MKKDLRVLITGGSSGLGRGLAVALARRGARIAVTGRREGKLQETARRVEEAGGQCLALLGSVTEPADVKAHYARIKERWGGLDWAVLNAGISESMDSREFKAENYHWVFATNVGGAVNWLEAVIPDMVASGGGTIAGVASLAAFRGMPRSGSYCASKAALLSLLESVRVDLIGTGVSVVTICPGFVRSEMTDRNDPSNMYFFMETEDGAAAMIRGIERGKRLVHFPFPFSHFVKYVVHNMPGFLFDWLVSRFGVRGKRPYVDESKAVK